MTQSDLLPSRRFAQISERGLRLALIFALAAERLSVFFDHGKTLSDTQAQSLAADWLRRAGRSLPRDEQARMVRLSARLAEEISGSVSREAGLYISHEMMEALDPNYRSELAESLMAECERLLDQADET